MPAHHALQPEQLKMFMSANEIMEHYQPLDADREGAGGTGSRTLSSGSNLPAMDNSGNYEHTTHGRQIYRRPERSETDEELWERKRDESWDKGLAQDIIDSGVQKPVSLGTQFGSKGKPQVVGGHHRLSVMAEESPDELMPVLHYRDLTEAAMQSYDAHRGRGGFRYT